MTHPLITDLPGPHWEPGMPPLGVAILGSTGSIGRQTIDVLRGFRERFRIVAITGGANHALVVEQANEFRPAIVGTAKPGLSPALLPAGTRVLDGDDALFAAATHPDVAIVVTATSGHAAIGPTAAAIELGKTIALANKETIVCAGEVILPLARKHGVAIRPVDSEHSAIWQSLGPGARSCIDRLVLTASGGPFRRTPLDALRAVTVEQALAHPTWAMGGKITIDSATMMNKGLEVIEAHWLFDIPYERIDVLVHPESIVHSLVEFADASMVGQFSLPDMRLPIQYALSYPDHLPGPCRRLDLATIGSLTFEAPDHERFPALRLAAAAGKRGGGATAVLSAADEVAVAAFLAGEIGFLAIVETVAEVVERFDHRGALTLDLVADIDHWARATTREVIAAR